MELLEEFAVSSVAEKDGVKEYAMKKDFFVASAFMSVVPTEINILPKPGSYKHSLYGEIKVTVEKNTEFIDNFNNCVYQELIPIDLEHETILSGAVGYYEPGTGRVASDGSGWVKVRWEERGQKALNEGRFYYFSPTWFDEWVEPLSKKKYNNVLIGGALTTLPYFKDKALKPLFASELKMSETDTTNFTTNGTTSNVTIGYVEPVGSSDASGMITVSTSTIPTGEKVTEPATPSVDPVKFAEMEAKVAQFAELERQAKDAQEQLKKANEALAKQADRDRKRHFSEIIRGVDGEGDGAKKFKGDAAVHGAVLEALALQYGEDSDEFKNYITEMRSLSEQLEASELLKNKGGNGTTVTTSDDPEGKWFSAVAEYMKDHKVSELEATTKVAGEQPKLYNAYRRAVTKVFVEDGE